jgi:hypothetical protein
MDPDLKDLIIQMAKAQEVQMAALRDLFWAPGQPLGPDSMRAVNELAGAQGRLESCRKRAERKG